MTMPGLLLSLSTEDDHKYHLCLICRENIARPSVPSLPCVLPYFSSSSLPPSITPFLPHSLAPSRNPTVLSDPQLWGVDVNTMAKRQLVVPPNDGDTEENLSLEEKLRRERQRLHATGVTSFFWSSRGSTNIRIMVPLQVSYRACLPACLLPASCLPACCCCCCCCFCCCCGTLPCPIPAPYLPHTCPICIVVHLGRLLFTAALSESG